MIVTFKNTGMLEEASVRLQGLTVIAGPNDTGKSTIGKLLFSIITVFNEKDTVVYLKPRIRSIIDDYFFTFRYRTGETSLAFDMGKVFFDELKKDSENWIRSFLDSPKTIDNIKEELSKKVSDFTESVKKTSGTDAQLDGITDRIVESIVQVKKKEDAWNASLADHFASNFGDDIANKFAPKPGYSIIAAIDQKTVFEISGSGDSIETKLNDTLYYQDATFVESPILVDLKEAIRLGKTDPDLKKDWKKKRDLLEQAYVPKYMRDFILKVTEREQKNEIPGVIDDIQKAIDGNFYYDHLENDFLFKKKGKTFKCLATASGIKYFGIISILSQTGFLGKRRLLILDEPETNVHPSWQIKLAEIIVKLVKEGCHILLTSHSPYFIEGLKLFADRYLEEDAAAFYLTGKNSGAPTSYLKNVTYDISPIFEALSSPFDELEMLQLKDL